MNEDEAREQVARARWLNHGSDHHLISEADLLTEFIAVNIVTNIIQTQNLLPLRSRGSAQL